MFKKSVRWCSSLALLASLGWGCSTRDVAVLEPEAEDIEIVSVAPEGCTSLGEVQGESVSNIDQADAVEGARNDLRNQTADLGGTHVELQQSTSESRASTGKVTLFGRAYCCPGRKVRC